ncbi:Lrp/AsnC family transcriptional regulator [Streptomyces cavernicola]|uniref:AsnC family transcriptional regulator n=1 Tax=Streptomyces cavernicola TaxID=3043613 RepID=A0ABT6SE68_9ACTN|nr:AsnC family transcriptional regulator [Streptomyces sp. B-S-A6]MDI3406259.1 AsnC family transcriptional regulator [Streptomyces sp. B-S-A6]
METQRTHTEPDRAHTLDELDLAIVHALQIQPRIPWVRAGEVLDVDPVTVARRWERMVRTGMAWVDGYLSPGNDDGVYAQIEIDMDGRPSEDTIGLLARDTCVLSLKQTSGGRDLLAIVGAADLDGLARLAGERISQLPGVRAVRSHVMTATPFEGASWRLRSLTRRQRQELAVERPNLPQEPLRPLDRRIALALGADGRMPLTELAETVEASTATVRRRLRVLTSTGRLSLRCALARPLTGFPISVVYFGSVPAQHLDETVSALRTLPGLRMCSITAGAHNLVLDIWLPDLADVHTTEALVNRRLAHLDLRITERAVVLRTVKHVGRILDRKGRSVGSAPLNYWDK